jgi:hypothetical protein
MKRILLSTFAIVALSLGSFAQLWITQNTGMAESRGITDMFAVDANIVWCAAYDGVTPTNACQDFCKTANGGTTWTPGTITGATGTSIANVVAIDANTAWAINYYPSGTGTKDGVYKTTNGGTSWVQQTTALFSNANSFPDCVHFWDANTGWCMGDPINGEFEIYTTTDGGTTWVAVPGSQIPNPLSGEFGVVGYYAAVGNTIWFGTNEGRVYKSIDQGHNWTVSAISGWSTIYVQPFFKDANTGFAMDKSAGTTVGNLAKTTDGGTTWVPITPTGQHFSNDMAYVPGTDATWVTTGADAANSLAGVNYSFDDCANFADMLETIGVQFLSEAWINDSTGWAGGFVTSGAGGMNKFNSVLALHADFMSNDTSILVFDSAHFVNNSLGDLTSYHWTFQGGIPASSNLKTPPPVQYLTAGSWNVSLTVTGALGSSTTTKTGYIHVGGVGINEHSKSAVTVYPNPVKDVMNVKANTNMQEVQILNLLGEVLISKTVNTNALSMNIGDLKAGVYTLKIKMDDGFVNKKIVIN